jgi:hypothetical protein
LYETNHSAYGSLIICNRKQGHYNDWRICEMMNLNEIHYNPTNSTMWFVQKIFPNLIHCLFFLYIYIKKINGLFLSNIALSFDGFSPISWHCGSVFSCLYSLTVFRISNFAAWASWKRHNLSKCASCASKLTPLVHMNSDYICRVFVACKINMIPIVFLTNEAFYKLLSLKSIFVPTIYMHNICGNCSY